MKRAAHIGLVLALGFFGASCGSEDSSGPPKLHLGLDQCATCGMIVSEERCSGALLCTLDGHREYQLFDDIGCLLDYHAAHPRLEIIDTFVHDYDTKQWLNAHKVYFVADDSSALRTPMGSGIVAFEKRQKAESHFPTGAPPFVTFDQLATFRLKHRPTHAGS